MTATAHATRPIVCMPKKVELYLVPALPEDFKIFKYTDPDGQPVYERKIGMVYWLYSHAENKILSTPYMIDMQSDLVELKEYMDANMVYIAPSPFKNNCNELRPV